MSSKPPFNRQNKKKEVKAPNYKAAGAIISAGRVKEISYNEHDRKDYLTGFHRRKVVRREFAEKRIAEKEKREKAEQKKFVKLQREAFQQSIIDSRKKHEKEYGLREDSEDEVEQEPSEPQIEQEETIDENGNKVKIVTTKSSPSSINITQVKEFTSDDKIVTTTVKPMSFNSDGEDEDESENDYSNSEDEEEQEEEPEEDKKNIVKKKFPNNKKEFTKFTKKETITADGLKLVDAEKKIYEDEKGRKIKMKKEKGKIIPVVLTTAAETALEKGWKLPRSLRTREKKSWSHTIQKKSKKKSKKEKKGKK